MKSTIATIVIAFNWVVLGYALAVALTQLMLVVGAAANLRRELRQVDHVDRPAQGEEQLHPQSGDGHATPGGGSGRRRGCRAGSAAS